MFVAKQLCVTHKIKLKDVVFDNDDEDDANDGTAAPAAPAQQQPDVVTTAVSDVESMISTIRQHEENKHTRVSSVLALFMKHHPDLAADLIPLVHTTMTTASGILVSDDNKELISLGHAIGKLSSSQSAPDAGQAGQLKARVFGTCCNCTCPVCL